MREAPGPCPSARAADRLATDVRGEVAGLRVALRRALDEAERLEGEGRHDRAAAVLEDQRAALADLHRRLAHRLASAAVEREAEHVVDTAPAVGGVAPAAGDMTALRLVASAAAAVAGVAVLLSPDLGGAVLRVAGWTTAAPPPVTAAAVPSAPDVTPQRGDTALAAAAAELDEVPAADRALTAAPTPAPRTGAAAGPPRDADLVAVADLIGRLAEAEAPPAGVLGEEPQGPTDDAPVGDEPEDGPTPAPSAPLSGPGDESVGPDDEPDTVPGAGGQTGLAPDAERAGGAIVVESTVERRGHAR